MNLRRNALLLQACLLLLLGLVGYGYVKIGTGIHGTEYPSDFYIFHKSGQAFRSGEGLYWQLPARSAPGDPCYRGGVDDEARARFGEEAGVRVAFGKCLTPNLNPPVTAIVLGPLASLSIHDAWLAWTLASLACSILAIVLALGPASGSGPSRTTLLLLAGLAFFAYPPTLHNYRFGQVTAFLLLPTVLAWRSLVEGRDARAGIWLGIAAGLKPFFGIFGLALLAAGRWRALGGFGVALTVLAALGGFAAGFDSYFGYVAAMRDVTWVSTNWNGSFLGFYGRILGGGDNQPWVEAPWLTRALVLTLSALAILVVTRVARRAAALDSRRLGYSVFATSIPAMLLVSPLGWLYYYPLLFVAALSAWRLAEHARQPRLVRMAVSASMLASCAFHDFVASWEMNDPADWFLKAGLYHYALVAMLAIAAFAAREASGHDVRDLVPPGA